MADPGRWAPVAEALSWRTPYRETFTPTPHRDDWFRGGTLNLAENCLDRHVAAHGDRVAVLWEGEPGDRRELTYRQLQAETVRFAGALRSLGVRRGDRVAVHLGWLPETVVGMLACARIGAEFTVIPVALPVEALALRLADFAPKILITQDGGWRHGSVLPLKARADEALESASGVEHTVVVRRTGMQVEWYEGDLWYADLLARSPEDVEPEALPADHTAVVVHLANRRGRPVAIRHGTANLAVAALATFSHGLRDGDVFWCAGDVSWLGAQAHGIYGPLLCGATAVMYEGTLDVPDPMRTWELVERYSVTSLLTSPSIVRTLRGWSPTAPSASTASLRRVTTIGERLDPDLRGWLRSQLGERVTVADGWGQLELGGIVAFDSPVDRDALPDPGFTILDEDGTPVPDGQVGEWVMLDPWPGTMRTADVEGEDPTAYHWTRFPGRYATGDLARRRSDGSVEFLGRMDEVVSISGQLVSLTEVREALQEQPFVDEAEVFERSDPLLGRSLAAAIVLHRDSPVDDLTLQQVQDGVRELLGGLSRPRALLVVDRFGNELDSTARRRALAILAASVTTRPVHVTWEQVLATAGA